MITMENEEKEMYVYVVIKTRCIAWNYEDDVDCVFESEVDAENYCEKAQKEHKKTSFTYYKTKFIKELD